jgi:4-amino-4-deoxy-L-arabinose transferase-like glycosyltransferase
MSVEPDIAPADEWLRSGRAPCSAWPGRCLRAIIGDWQSHPDLNVLLLLVLVAMAPRVFLQAMAPSFVFTESPGYVEPALSLVHGEGLTPRLQRPIGYPVLVAAGLSTAGELSFVTALQHLLAIMTVALTYLLGRACANRLVGLAAGLAVALSAPQLTYEHALVPEAPFTLLLVGFCLLLLWSLGRGGLFPLLFSGLVLAIATLVRPVAQLLLPFALLAPLLSPSSPRRRLLHAAIASVAFAMVVMPWMLVNRSTPSRFGVGRAPSESLLAGMLTNGRGHFIFDGQGIPAAADPAEQSARSVLQAAARGGTPPDQVRDQVRARVNLSEAETDLLLQRIATDTIRRQPIDFLLTIPDALVTLYRLDERGITVLWPSLAAWATVPNLNSLVRLPTFDQELNKSRVDALLNVLRPNRFDLVLPLLGLLAPALAWRSPQRRAVYSLTALYAYLILVQVTVDGPVARQRYSAEPLLAVLAAVALWHSLSLASQRLAQPASAGWAGIGGRGVSHWALLGLVAGLGVFLRCWGLARFDPSVFGNEYDEGIRMAQLDLMHAGFQPLSQIYASQGPLLLDYFYPFYNTFGQDVLAARLAVTAASIACLAAVYLVGRLLRDPLAGLASLGLLATSPAMIDIARPALAEVPSLGPACLSLWLAVRASSRRPIWLYLSAALFAFGLLLKPMVAPVAAPILVALAPSWRRPVSRQQFEWALTTATVTCLAILAIGPDRLWEQFVAYRQGATGLGALGNDAWSLDTNWQQIRTVLPDDAALATLALAALPALFHCSPRYAIVAGGWLLTTFVMLLVYSPLAEKHVAYLIPSLALLGGGGLSAGRALLRTPRSAWRTALLAPIGVACAFAVLSSFGTARAAWRPSSPNRGTIAAGGDLQDALALATRVTNPTDFLVTDHPYLAHLAHRLIPPRLVDPSRTRILSGALTDQEAIQQTQAHQVRVVIYWASRLQLLKRYSAWVDSEYTLVRLYDQNRALYVRNDSLNGLPGYPGGAPSLALAHFGDVVSLTGFEVEQNTSRQRRISLAFQALRPIEPNLYVVHLQLRDQAGNVKFDRDDPLLPSWRAAPWAPGQNLVHRRSLNLDKVAPGRYSLVLYFTAGHRGPELPTTLSSGAAKAGPSPSLVDLGTLLVR